MNHALRNWISVVGLFLFASCSYERGGFQAEPSPLPKLTKEQLLKDFGLFDQFGNAGPPADPETGKWPYGAFLIAGHGKRGFCTASHIVPTRVVVSAHCLEGERLSDYEVVFYTTHRELVHTPLTRIVYPGDEDNRDVAVVEIPVEEALRWHTVVSALPTPLPESAPIVKMMSLDPRSLRLGKKVGGAMAAFKKCPADHEVPLFRKYSTGLAERLTDERKTINPNWQIYLGNCVDLFEPSRPKSSLLGNSGSLVLDETGIPIASFHWLHTMKSFLNEEVYAYFPAPFGETFDVVKRWGPVKSLPEDPLLVEQGNGKETSFIHVATTLAEVIRHGGPDVFFSGESSFIGSAREEEYARREE